MEGVISSPEDHLSFPFGVRAVVTLREDLLPLIGHFPRPFRRFRSRSILVERTLQESIGGRTLHPGDVFGVQFRWFV